MGIWDTITGWFGGGGDDENSEGNSLFPDTKDGCNSYGEKLVYWDPDAGECKPVDNTLIAKLNACNKSGSHFDFTDKSCKSNLGIVPRCGEGNYYHEQEGELGKCISREDLCKFKSVELAEGFTGHRKYAKVYNEGSILLYTMLIVLILMFLRKKRV